MGLLISLSPFCRTQKTEVNFKFGSSTPRAIKVPPGCILPPIVNKSLYPSAVVVNNGQPSASQVSQGYRHCCSFRGEHPHPLLGMPSNKHLYTARAGVFIEITAPTWTQLRYCGKISAPPHTKLLKLPRSRLYRKIPEAIEAVKDPRVIFRQNTTNVLIAQDSPSTNLVIRHYSRYNRRVPDLVFNFRVRFRSINPKVGLTGCLRPFGFGIIPRNMRLSR